MGYWLGVTKNCGDCYTYHIYIPETHQVIARSVIRPVSSTNQHDNVRMGRDPNLHSALHDMDTSTEVYDAPLDFTSINQCLHVTPTFELPISNSQPIVVSRLNAMSFDIRHAYTFTSLDESTDNDDNSGTTEQPTTEHDSRLDTEYLFGSSVDDDPDLLNYYLLVDHWNQHSDPNKNIVFQFNGILNHCRQGTTQEVLVDWKVGTPKWEKVGFMKNLDILALAKYAKDNHLTNRRGWKWAKRIDINAINRLEAHLRYLHSSSSCRKAYRSRQRKWKFGFQVPTSVHDAFVLDEENGNTLWGDAIKKELFELKLYDCFRPLSRG